MRLIDADEACKGCVRYGTDLSCEDCVVKSAPTVDAVEVVRCKDCRSAHKGGSGYIWCKGVPHSLYWFCADGEQMGGEE